jgi:hypothetical protein
MRVEMKKIMTLVIVVSLLFSSGALFAKERQGAQLVITKIDVTVIKAELIGVKQDSTLILESSSRISGSIDLSEVKIIKIFKGRNTAPGVFLGLLAGGATGVVVASNIRREGEASSTMMFKNMDRDIERTLAVSFCLLAGGILGGAIGSSIHNYETLQIEGKPQEQIKTILENLRTQARFPEYQ